MDLAPDLLILGTEGGQALVGYGPFSESEQVDPQRASFYLQNFYLARKKSWLIPATTRLIDLAVLKHQLGALPKIIFEKPGYEDYAQVFETFQRELSAARLQKAVPVIFEQGRIVSGNLRQVLPMLAKLPGSLHPFAVCLGDECVVGASPEILFRKEQESRLIFSEAVAGTTLSNDSDRLLDSPHLGREHRVVVDDIRERLGVFGRIVVSTNSFQPYPGLMHLKAEITLDPHGAVNPEALIEALHPTGALGLLPRQSLSSAFLRKLDPQNCRGFYGAPFGVVLPNGYWKFIVMIRCLMSRADQVLLGSGGGLIASSTLASEWAELEAKRSGVKRLLLQQ